MNLTVGMIYTLTFALKRHGQRVEESFTAQVTHIERARDGQYFSYQPVGPDAWKHGSWGCANLYDAGPKPYNLQRAELYEPRFPMPKPAVYDHGWMVGHPGYDLH